MKTDSERHHRRSIRLKSYDYARAGAYFITLCVQDRACLFGNVVDGEGRLRDAGRMVQTVWDELPVHYLGVDIDAFAVMPNHIHGIIVLDGVDRVGAGPRACPRSACPDEGQPRGVAPTVARRARGVDRIGQPRGVAPTSLSLPDVMHRFKTMATKRYADGVKQSAWPTFHDRLWQRNYYEHIVRDEASLNRIRQYIAENPARWPQDRENPAALAPEPENAWAI